MQIFFFNFIQTHSQTNIPHKIPRAITYEPVRNLFQMLENLDCVLKCKQIDES